MVAKMIYRAIKKLLVVSEFITNKNSKEQIERAKKTA
jgi:CO dehydrogenase/acetyl-CoA synthase epsilon subunit